MYQNQYEYYMDYNCLLQCVLRSNTTAADDYFFPKATKIYRILSDVPCVNNVESLASLEL